MEKLTDEEIHGRLKALMSRRKTKHKPIKFLTTGKVSNALQYELQ